MSFRAENETLRSVLNRISSEYNINITFNSSNPTFDQPITWHGKKETPMDILRELLTSNKYEYRVSGNHLVILKSPDLSIHSSTRGTDESSEPEYGQDEPQSDQPESDKSESLRNVIEHNTDIVFLRDTVFVRDTVVLTRTEFLIDTVFVERVPQESAVRPESFIRDIFGVEANGRDRWAMSFSVSQLAAGFSTQKPDPLTTELEQIIDAEKLSLRNFGLGAALHYNSGRFSVAGHLGINSFAYRFSWSELYATGGFNQIDTLDTFFTINQNDTTWTHITDTTWIPLDSREVIFDRMNRLGFFESGISGTYTFVAGRNSVWYATAGFAASTPLWISARSVTDSEGFPAGLVSRDNFNTWLYSWSLSMGTRLRINSLTDLFAETWYKRYINEWNTDHPLDRRMHGAGIRIGVLYFF